MHEFEGICLTAPSPVDVISNVLSTHYRAQKWLKIEDIINNVLP